MSMLLRYSDPLAAGHPLHARYAAVTPGAPGRCPDCDAFGFIDEQDAEGRYQTQHCRACGAAWEYRFDAWGGIAEVHDRRTGGTRTAHTIDLRTGSASVLDLRSRAATT